MSSPSFSLSLMLVLFLAACGKPATRLPAGRSSSPTVQTSEKTGLYHSLARGETLYGLSRTYHVPVSRLISANGISDPTDIPAGTPIFVPGANRILPIAPGKGPLLSWPLHGAITSRFGPRGRHRQHTGIDIDGDKGQPIHAAAEGRVLRAGRSGRYGLRVILSHGKGLTTLYAHASKLLVHEGEKVHRGETIAKVGDSGNAHGTHLHFEVREKGRPVDPSAFLR